ncbi:hypothetical protein FB45DRAFT_929403, partial [Roridomyces roridus]
MRSGYTLCHLLAPTGPELICQCSEADFRSLRSYISSMRLHSLQYAGLLSPGFTTLISPPSCAYSASRAMTSNNAPRSPSTFLTLTVVLLALEDFRGRSSHHPAGEQILPHLTCWQFVRVEKYGQDELVWRLLDRYSAPALARLDIACLAAPARLEALLARSQCPLTHLALRHCRVRVGELLDILKQTPGLECLVIEHGLIPTMITDRFFEALTLRNGAGLVPKLAKLRVVGHYFFREAAMLEMMESRDRAVLKDVELVLPVSAVQELRRLKPSIDERVCLDVLERGEEDVV